MPTRATSFVQDTSRKTGAPVGKVPSRPTRETTPLTEIATVGCTAGVVGVAVVPVGGVVAGGVPVGGTTVPAGVVVVGMEVVGNVGIDGTLAAGFSAPLGDEP